LTGCMLLGLQRWWQNATALSEERAQMHHRKLMELESAKGRHTQEETDYIYIYKKGISMQLIMYYKGINKNIWSLSKPRDRKGKHRN